MLRVVTAIVFALLALCAGGARAVTAPDYWVHMNPMRQAGLLVWKDGGQWVSEWIADGKANATWRDPNDKSGALGSVEHYTMHDGYMMLDGFSDPAFFAQHPDKAEWPITCIKATLVDLNSGESFALDCSHGGHPYAPALMPRDPWGVRIWGVIANSKRFYWQGDFYPDTTTDACYYSGPISRETIREREVWYDSAGGWSRGTGSPPFDAQGNPVDPHATEQSETIIGRNEGVMGVRDLVTGRESCLYSLWNW